jgi:IS4 transposase
LLLNNHKKDLTATVNNYLSDASIEAIARETKFTKRNRKLPASCFVNALMFSEYNQCNVSLPDLAADISQVYCIGISKEAMHKKFTQEAVCFLKALLNKVLTQQLQLSKANNLNHHFPCIKIKDSTKFSLPSHYDNIYSGYKNFSRKNGLMCMQYEYDLVSGNWLSIAITKGLRNDQRDAAETIEFVTAGDLHIRDLGYITPTYLSGVVERKAFFLNRLPAMAGVFTNEMKPLDWKKVNQLLNSRRATSMEMDVLVYEKSRIPCRLIIERVSESEYAKRLAKANAIAKSKRIGVSELHKIKLRFNTFITNVSPQILPIAAIRKTYYLRWQVELVFKTWKSFFSINKVKHVKKERLECQLLARLLWILINWQLFKNYNQHIRNIDGSKGVSIIMFFKRCLKFATTLRLVLQKRMGVTQWLKYIYLPLVIDCICEAPVNKRTHYETLSLVNSS